MKQLLVNFAVTAFAGFWMALAGGPALADDLDDLYTALREADETTYEDIENKIWREWSRSGSVAMDLLLTRGRDAMQEGDFQTAIAHFSALIDHAPDFAEGYNARATAYFQIGRYGPSIADIRTTLALNPRHFGAIGGLAMMLEELGYSEEALEAYRAVHEMNPQRPGAAEAIERLERETRGAPL